MNEEDFNKLQQAKPQTPAPQFVTGLQAVDFQKRMQEEIIKLPTPLRKAIYEEIEATVKEQRKLMAEAGHIGSAMLKGGAPEELVMMQQEALRHCALAVAQSPTEFAKHWLRMTVCAVMLYEDQLEVQQAVADAQSTQPE